VRERDVKIIYAITIKFQDNINIYNQENYAFFPFRLPCTNFALLFLLLKELSNT